MIIPSADVEYSNLICSLHGLAHRYKYGAYRKKSFPKFMKSYLEYETDAHIPTLVRDVRKEQKSVRYGHSMEYRIREYRATLAEFVEYMETTYAEQYPEILI